MEVKLENLSKVFPGTKNRPSTTAVGNMNLVIPDGQLVGLLGPSGCGKSTTLYMIAGLHKPTDGKIFFGEEEVTNVPPEKRGIGLVFQNYALYPHLTVRQNIMFPLENIRPKMPKEKMAEIVNEMAKLVDIDRYLDRKPKELSGGQQQRVAIARALAKKPQVLLLDEPLSNLDARLRLQTREEIKRIQRETGITTIFVTHDQEEAMSISDFIVVMKMGVIQQIGKPQDVYDEPINLFVAKFLGSPAINVFDGRIVNNKVYVDGKVFDGVGFTGKGELDLGSEEAYDAYVTAGYKGTYNDYLKLVYHFGEETQEVPETTGTEEHPEVQQEVVYEKGEPIEDYKFEAEIKERMLSMGIKLKDSEVEEALEKVREDLGLNRIVKIAVRPESFIVDEKGKIPVDVRNVEHIGRDVSIVGTISKQTHHVRILIPSDLRGKVTSDKLSFSAKKYYVFETSGTRLK